MAPAVEHGEDDRTLAGNESGHGWPTIDKGGSRKNSAGALPDAGFAALP
jgi:hypothetical protein